MVETATRSLLLVFSGTHHLRAQRVPVRSCIGESRVTLAHGVIGLSRRIRSVGTTVRM